MLSSVALLLLAACSEEGEPTKPIVDIAAGRDIAEARCMDCHGMDGRGEKDTIPNLAAQPAGYLSESLHAYKEGRRQHAALLELTSGMSDADIRNIAGYYSSLPALPAADATLTPEASASSYHEGEQVATICAECHGAKGYSQEPVYLVNAIKSYRDHERQHEDMIADRSDSEIEDIAAYYSVQQTEAADDENIALQELMANCDRCHGPALGKSRMGGIPALGGQNREYPVRVMQAYREDDRDSSLMHRMSANYRDETIAALAT